MKFTPVTERLPQLNKPLLITVLYESDKEPTITESELFNDPCSTINPCFNMGSAKKYKVFSWAYIPKPVILKSYIEYHEFEWNNADRAWDRPRTIVK